MKATAKLLVAAVAAGGTLLAMDAQANLVGRGSSPSAMPRSASVPSSRGAGGVDHGGNRHGHGGGHGHHHGGYYGGYYPWYPYWSFYWGIPIMWDYGYWGAPYYGPTVVYRENEQNPQFLEHQIGPATTEVPRTGQAMPSQGPLYMNYCESARAYFPKVTTCPEGWKLSTPTN